MCIFVCVCRSESRLTPLLDNTLLHIWAEQFEIHTGRTGLLYRVVVAQSACHFWLLACWRDRRAAVSLSEAWLAAQIVGCVARVVGYNIPTQVSGTVGERGMHSARYKGAHAGVEPRSVVFDVRYGAHLVAQIWGAAVPRANVAYDDGAGRRGADLSREADS